MRKLLIIILCLVIEVPILSACWNQKELTDLAIILAMGVDKGEGKKFKLSFQLVNPGNVSSGQNGQGGQGLPIAVYKSSGDTLTEAARKATKILSRRLYYAHTNLLVISDKVARKDMLNILDALERDPEFRTTTQLVIARGSTSAEELVSTLTLLDKLPVTKITKELQSTEQMLGENMQVTIDDFITDVVSDGKHPLANGYRVIGNQAKANQAENLQKTTSEAYPKADGLAIFNHGKLKGWIDHHEARGVMWVLNKVKGTDMNIDWKGKKNAISVGIIRSKTKVAVQYKQGRPTADIHIEDEGWISEANTDVDLTDPKIIGEIQKLVEKKTAAEITAAVKKAQRIHCDIFGFGDKLHRSNPKLWKRVKGDWDERFTDLKVNVSINTYVRREGIRTKPFWSDMMK